MVSKRASLDNPKVVSLQASRPLPDQWPTQEHYDRVKNGKLSVRKVTRDFNPEMSEKYDIHLNSKDTYPMFHSPRGNALIIANNEFLKSKPRLGSEVDESGLRQLFEGLGFKVKMKKNLTKEGIENAIRDETRADHETHDCFVLFMLTCGRQGTVLGTDSQPVSMKSIIDKIYAVEDLKNKPKLLFFQACPGDDGDEEKIVDQAKVLHPSEEDDERLDDERDGNQAAEDEDDLTIPMYEDIFVVRSSTDGCGSYCDTSLGSSFTQSLIFVFSEYACICEFHGLFQKTSQLVSNAEPRQDDAPEIKFIPQKNLYFFPGLSN